MERIVTAQVAERWCFNEAARDHAPVKMSWASDVLSKNTTYR
jgi:hypothetical protein